MSNQIPTTERLAQAMEAAGCPQDMIDKARAGYYDDYKSELALPIIQLVYDLTQIGQKKFVRRVINGEFDATLKESNEWWKKEGKATLLREFQQSKENE